MAEKRNFLICYDITDPKRWRKVHRILSDQAMAVQYSVFEAELSNTQLQALTQKLQKCLHGEEDKLTIYRLFKVNPKTELAATTDDELLYI